MTTSLLIAMSIGLFWIASAVIVVVLCMYASLYNRQEGSLEAC